MIRRSCNRQGQGNPLNAYDEAGQVKDAVKTLVDEMQMRFEEILDRFNSDP